MGQENNKEDQQNIEPLNNKQLFFVDEYLTCFVAYKAYLKVYPDSSPEAAMSSSSDLLREPKINAEIKRRIDELRGRIPDDLIKHLTNLVFFNISDLLDDNGDIDKKKIKTNAIPGIVSGITIKDTTSEKSSSSTVSFKLIDQNKAAEILSKLLKLYGDGPKGPPVVVNVGDDVAGAIARLGEKNDNPRSK